MGVSERRKSLMFEDSKEKIDKEIQILFESFSHAEHTTCVGLARMPGGGMQPLTVTAEHALVAQWG